MKYDNNMSNDGILEYNIKFIDLIKKYHDLKYSHRLAFDNKSTVIEYDKMFNEYISLLPFNIDKELFEDYIQNLKDEHKIDIHWNLEKDDEDSDNEKSKELVAFEEMIELLLEDNVLQLPYDIFEVETIINEDYSNDVYEKNNIILINLIIFYIEYFKFIFNSDEMKRKYQNSCNEYLDFKKGQGNFNIYQYSNKIRKKIKNFFLDVGSDDIRRQREFLKGANNKSLLLSLDTYICFIIVLTMFDNNFNLITYVKKQDWELLEDYEKMMILFITYYITYGDKRYVNIIRKIHDPIKPKIKNQLKSILSNVDRLQAHEKDEFLNDIYEVLTKIHEKLLSHDLKLSMDDYLELAFKKRKDKIKSKKQNK
ncbi:MAG: hypothetical protein NC320_13425 [Clostridium sp.]|nr:hypothetical protein [Clostridium sp.]